MQHRRLARDRNPHALSGTTWSAPRTNTSGSTRQRCSAYVGEACCCRAPAAPPWPRPTVGSNQLTILWSTGSRGRDPSVVVPSPCGMRHLKLASASRRARASRPRLAAQPLTLVAYRVYRPSRLTWCAIGRAPRSDSAGGGRGRQASHAGAHLRRGCGPPHQPGVSRGPIPGCLPHRRPVIVTVMLAPCAPAAF
jgi:hypothetical protein